jgi:hypothetical protein
LRGWNPALSSGFVLPYSQGFRRSASTILCESGTILRNYSIAAHLRFIFEEISPERRQYFFESEKDGAVQPR